MRVGGLLEDVVLAVVDLVQQVLIVDAKDLVLEKGPISLLVFLFDLHRVFLGLLALVFLILLRVVTPAFLSRRKESCRVKLLLDALALGVVALDAALTDEPVYHRGSSFSLVCLAVLRFDFKSY